MRKLLGLAVLLACFTSMAQGAISNSARMKDIVEESTGLWLTKGMHSEFWQLLNSEMPDRGQRANVVRALREASMKMLPWQEAVYESFLISYRTGEPQWTDEYVKQVEVMRDLYPMEVERAVAMNRAAASGRPMVTDAGEFFVTEELILSVLENMKVSKFRLDRLFAEDWTEKSVLFEYPELGLNLLWDEPWVQSNTVLKKGDTSLLNEMINLEKPNGDGWQIVMTKYPSSPSAPLENQRRTLEGTATSLGIKEHIQYEMDWKGLESSIQTGTLTFDGVEYQVKNSATYIPRLQSMMQRMVWSSEPAATQAEFARLSQSVMFINRDYAVVSNSSVDKAKEIPPDQTFAEKMEELGISEEVADVFNSISSNASDSEEFDDLRVAYGNLLRLNDREIAIELSLDPARKAKIGLAEEKLIKANTNYPVYIDEYTSYSGMHYDIEEEALVYHYTMTSEIAVIISSMSHEEKNAMQLEFEGDSARRVCGISLELLSRGFDMAYSYRSPAGNQLFSVVTTHSECAALGY